MTHSIQIRNAMTNEADYLSGLAYRSKKHWGYSPEFMHAATHELTVTPGDIRNDKFHYFVASIKTVVVGFYSLEEQSVATVELGAMFVEPDFIGSGVGKVLMDHAKTSAAKLGVSKIIIQSDPHAASFYQAAGGKVTGKRASESIAGHVLPRLEIALSN